MLPPRGSSQKGARRGPPVLQVAGMSPLTLLLVGMTSAATLTRSAVATRAEVECDLVHEPVDYLYAL
jgi:hypothetical protein